MMTLSTNLLAAIFLCGLLGLCAGAAGDDKASKNGDRPRACDLGIKIGVLPPGPLCAITDVPGVRVGHATLLEGEDVRTGVTAIVPHQGNLFQQKTPAAVVVGNGFGKLIGATQVEELGLLETPIVLTNTLSAFMAADALVTYTLSAPGNENVLSVNPVVGECNDGYLNNIRVRRVRRDDVLTAIAAARSGAVAEGAVGAGTGTQCLGFKGGIGTASRKLPKSLADYTVGVLVQTNFSGVLSIGGAPVGKELGRYYLKKELETADSPQHGSCMIVVATDAPLDARQLKRLARRALLGLGAVGSPMTHGSGDYVLAFSTDPRLRTAFQSDEPLQERTTLRDDAMSPLFQAVREATEEAVVNSLLKATTIKGYQGHTSEAIPADRVVEICKRHGVIGP